MAPRFQIPEGMMCKIRPWIIIWLLIPALMIGWSCNDDDDDDNDDHENDDSDFTDDDDDDNDDNDDDDLPAEPPYYFSGDSYGLTVDEGPLRIFVFDTQGAPLFSTTNSPENEGYEPFTLLFEDQNGDKRWWVLDEIRKAAQTGRDEYLFDVTATPLRRDKAGATINTQVELTLDSGSFRFRLLPIESQYAIATVGTTFLISEDDHFFGAGELFDSCDSLGKWRNLFMTFGTSPGDLNEAHVPTPFYFSPRGYGVFFDTTHYGHIDFGAKDSGALRAAFTDDKFDMHIYVDPSPLNIVEMFAGLVGTTPTPPKWVFAPQHWRNVADSQDDVMDDLLAQRENDLPASVEWVDAPWMTAYETFVWNETQFPDPQGMIDTATDLGYKMVVWAAPIMDYTDDSGEMEGMWTDTHGLFNQGARNDYYLKTPLLDTWYPSFWWKGTGATVDFTNPEALEWFKDLIRPVVQMGISGFKLDDGELILPGMRNSLGERYMEMYQSYRLGYHRAFREVLDEELGEGEGYIISRLGMARNGKYGTCLWPGDLSRDLGQWGLRAAIRAGLSAGMVVNPFYGSDIGGFGGGDLTDENFSRWIAFGALSPIMQTGGGGSHEPWDLEHFSQTTLDTYKKFSRLHMDLFPYLYTYAKIHEQTGAPVMRHLVLHYPTDPVAVSREFEYLLGDYLLVRPIVEAGGYADVYFPDGVWVDFLTGETVQGSETLTGNYTLIEMPLFVLAGAVIPMGDPEIDTLADAANPDVVTWEQRKNVLIARAYPVSGQPGTPFVLHDQTSLKCEPADGGLALEISGAGSEIDLTWEVFYENVMGDIGEVTRTAPLQATLTQTDEDGFETCDDCWYAQGGILYIKTAADEETLSVMP